MNSKGGRKIPRVESPPIVNGKVESKGPSGALSMTLPDSVLLDCPICFQPLCSPVYQCENGHIACASCCTTVLKNKCSNCGLPIRNIRCRAIEKILESGRVKCRYAPCGCKEVFSYSRLVGHEKSCNYIPCSCPFIGCDFAGTSKRLFDHSAKEHKDSSRQFSFHIMTSILMDTSEKHVFLREETKGLLFVVNRCEETFGSLFNVVCVAPPESEERFLYELVANIGEECIKLKSSVEMTPKWTPKITAKQSLVVPSYLINTGKLLRLDLIVGNKPARFYSTS